MALVRRDRPLLVPRMVCPWGSDSSISGKSCRDPFVTTRSPNRPARPAWGRDIAPGRDWSGPYYVSPLDLGVGRAGAPGRVAGAIRLAQLCVGCLTWRLVFVGRAVFGRLGRNHCALLRAADGTLFFTLGDLSAVWLETLLAALLPLPLAGIRDAGPWAGGSRGRAGLARPTLLLFALLFTVVPLLIRGSAGFEPQRRLSRGRFLPGASCSPSRR